MPSSSLKPRVLLAPGVPDLAALGARCVEDLLGLTGALEGEPRAELLRRERGSSLWRVPLPGTPGPDGRFRGRPRGAGTGWLWIERFERPPLAELLRARFGHPRSSSLAVRAWNLLCHLRAHGVPTPEPLAVGELAGEPLARRSVLVTRELERALPLPAWLAGMDAARKRSAARALGLLLARMAWAGVMLPELALEDVFAAQPRPRPGGGCGSSSSDGSSNAGRLAGLRARDLPELLVARVRGGRIGRSEPRAPLAQLERLSAGSVAGSARELLAVWYRARGRGLSRAVRRTELARFARLLERGS